MAIERRRIWMCIGSVTDGYAGYALPLLRIMILGVFALCLVSSPYACSSNGACPSEAESEKSSRRRPKAESAHSVLPSQSTLSHVSPYSSSSLRRSVEFNCGVIFWKNSSPYIGSKVEPPASRSVEVRCVLLCTSGSYRVGHLLADNHRFFRPQTDPTLSSEARSGFRTPHACAPSSLNRRRRADPQSGVSRPSFRLGAVVVVVVVRFRDH